MFIITSAGAIWTSGGDLFFRLIREICRAPRIVSLTTAIATYFVLWWIVLFAVLPWGVRSQEENGSVSPGTDPGAPAMPALWRKVVWTTIASSIVFAAGVLLFQYRIVTLERLASWLGVPW